MPAEPVETIIGAVLAGGRGRRMGAPKGGIELCGRPLIGYPLAAIAASGMQAVVVAKGATALPPLDVPVWLEPDEPTHPLLGIVSVLEQAGSPVVICGCDMPFVTPALLGHLARLEAPLAVPSVNGRLHPLIARYEPSLTEPLARALASREPLQVAVARLEPTLVDEEELRRFGDPERLLFNVNTPADLAEAERLLELEKAGG